TESDESDWTAVTASNGGSINPLSAPDFVDLSVGQTYRDWSPFAKNYRFPCISLDDMKFDHMAAQQLVKHVNKAKEITDEVFSNRVRYEYARLVPQIIASPGFGAGI